MTVAYSDVRIDNPFYRTDEERTRRWATHRATRKGWWSRLLHMARRPKPAETEEALPQTPIVGLAQALFGPPSPKKVRRESRMALYAELREIALTLSYWVTLGFLSTIMVIAVIVALRAV
jgi:hypothetical protein